MRLIRHIQSGSTAQGPCALAIGNFDGLHRGHQALVKSVCARSDALTPALMCFEPLPTTFFRPDQPLPRLTSVRDKLQLCRAFGLEQVFMPRFNSAFASLEPDQFVENILVRGADARVVVVGEDFRFGARAAGDVARLLELGRRHGFEVDVQAAVIDDGERISSTGLRRALAAGDLARARRWLGRRYAISGRVLNGQALGRTLDYPTVNLRPPLPPALSGVFAVRVSGAGLDRHPGVANLGQRPTVDAAGWLLEAHLFDYDGDLYGQHLSVEFIEWLRPEVKFASLDEMKAQMEVDAEKARKTLNPEP
ncbi:MAG: bifunctional riboflavin kinase/FAD synthetase [Wenzhouxiangella sp.]|nr:MAG: bifunctional riboflavin kinase/FAD synthetase [Wenzhouxiangella sp.]